MILKLAENMDREYEVDRGMEDDNSPLSVAKKESVPKLSQGLFFVPEYTSFESLDKTPKANPRAAAEEEEERAGKPGFKTTPLAAAKIRPPLPHVAQPGLPKITFPWQSKLSQSELTTHQQQFGPQSIPQNTPHPLRRGFSIGSNGSYLQTPPPLTPLSESGSHLGSEYEEVFEPFEEAYGTPQQNYKFNEAAIKLHSEGVSAELPNSGMENLGGGQRQNTKKVRRKNKPMIRKTKRRRTARLKKKV